MRKTIIISILSMFMLVLGVILSSPSPSSASELTTTVNSGVIDLDNLEYLEKTGQVTVNELTYDEFIEKRAKAKGISIEEAKKMYSNPNNSIKQSGTSSSTTQMATASSGYYSMHEINIRQNVAWSYNPSVQIFVWTYNSGSFRQFNYIEEVDLDREDPIYGISKHFTGKVKGKITDPTSIWWYVNGDFYDNGNTSVTGGFGGSWATQGVTVTANFSISYASNHFKYWNNSGTYFAY